MSGEENIMAPRSAAAGGFRQFAKRFVLVVAVVLGALLIISAAQVILLLFFGILCAVLLCSLSGWVAARTGFLHKWSLALVTVGLVALLAGVGLLVAPSVGAQFGELQKTLPESWKKVEQQLGKYYWGRQTLDAAEEADEYLPEPGALVQRALGIFSTTAGALSGILVVLFLGLCMAIEPETYVGGLVKLVPIPRRERTREVLAFIPNVGPIIAAIPAVLLAFTISPASALHVALLFIGVQTVESYCITPILERKTVSLPPTLTGAVQIALGLSVGMLGVILAAPLTAAGIVLVRKLYVEDALGDRTSAKQ